MSNSNNLVNIRFQNSNTQEEVQFYQDESINNDYVHQGESAMTDQQGRLIQDSQVQFEGRPVTQQSEMGRKKIHQFKQEGHRPVTKQDIRTIVKQPKQGKSFFDYT